MFFIIFFIKSLLEEKNIMNTGFGLPSANFDITIPKKLATLVKRFIENERLIVFGNYQNIKKVNFQLFNDVEKSMVKPGKVYQVKLFPIERREVTFEECLLFLKSQGAILVGDLGILLLVNILWEHCERWHWVIPDTHIVSLNEKEFIKRNNEYLTMSLFRSSGGGYDVSLRDIKTGFRSMHHLMCLCEKK
ncbi:hypothetical protein ACFL05_00065 [Patescibacteria group bacterium]